MSYEPYRDSLIVCKYAKLLQVFQAIWSILILEWKRRSKERMTNDEQEYNTVWWSVRLKALTVSWCTFINSGEYNQQKNNRIMKCCNFEGWHLVHLHLQREGRRVAMGLYVSYSTIVLWIMARGRRYINAHAETARDIMTTLWEEKWRLETLQDLES